MHILNIICSMDPAGGGPIEGALQLTAQWQARGHDVSFATLDAENAPYLEGLGVPVATLGRLGTAMQPQQSRRFLERFGYSSRFVPWLRTHAADHDVVLVHGLWNYAISGASRVLPGSTTPYFIFPHGALDPWFATTYPLKHRVKAMLWPFAEGRLINHATATLFTTEEEQALAADAFSPYRARPEVVGYGSADATGDTESQRRLFRAAVPALGNRRFLLFLSRIHPKKGCDLLIRSFARLAATQPDLDLVFAGPDQTGWETALRELATTYGVGDRIHWTGMIAGDLKWGAFHACEAFVLPSHSENFGIVVAEALACARPVLITDKVNLWREVDHAGAGLVARDDQAGIDDLLDRFCLMDDDARATMSTRARQCYEAHFRFDGVAERLLHLFAGAIHDRP